MYVTYIVHGFAIRASQCIIKSHGQELEQWSNVPRTKRPSSGGWLGCHWPLCVYTYSYVYIYVDIQIHINLHIHI